MSEKPEVSFGSLVFWRAWFAAWGFFGSKAKDAVLFVAILIVGGGAYYWLYGLPATRDQIVPVLIFTVGPMAGLWLAIFVWHLWLAPSALVYDNAKEAMDRQADLPQPTIPDAPYPGRVKMAVNWASWKDRDQFTIYEFAKILAQEEPASQTMSEEASGFARLLLENVKSKKLDHIPSMRRTVRGGYATAELSNYTLIKRGDAIAWAEARKHSIAHIQP